MCASVEVMPQKRSNSPLGIAGLNLTELRSVVSIPLCAMALTIVGTLGCGSPDRGGEPGDEGPGVAEGGSGASPDSEGTTTDSGSDPQGESITSGDGPGSGNAEESRGSTGRGGEESGGPGTGETGETGDTGDTGEAGVCGRAVGFPRNDAVPNPVFADEVNVSSTIVIDEPGVYDFKNVLHVWNGSGSCNQQENQPYILRIASSDVTLRNFAYRNAPDGIHIGTANDGQGHSYGDSIGNIVLDNVTGWACEDALTTQYGVQDITITNSTFLANPNSDHQDKLLQLNFGDAVIEDTTFYGSDTCVMFKGDQDVEIRHSRFIDCNRGINGSTIHGIVGNINTGPSTLETECNESYYAAHAWEFWGGFKMATAFADVDGNSVNDFVYDNGIHEAQDGGSMSVTCHPDTVAADLCGPAHVE